MWQLDEIETKMFQAAKGRHPEPNRLFFLTLFKRPLKCCTCVQHFKGHLNNVKKKTDNLVQDVVP